MRFIADARIRTRCVRRRSRSRSARSSSDGIQSSGTRSRRASSASTRASTLSVLHASGATSRTLRACAICTRQPAATSWSRTQIAPLIISTTARTSVPRSITNRAKPSASAGTAPSPTIVPASLSEHHAARRYDQSIPRYSTTGPPLRGLRSRQPQSAGRPTFGAPSFMTFHCASGSATVPAEEHAESSKEHPSTTIERPVVRAHTCGQRCHADAGPTGSSCPRPRRRGSAIPPKTTRSRWAQWSPPPSNACSASSTAPRATARTSSSEARPAVTPGSSSTWGARWRHARRAEGVRRQDFAPVSDLGPDELACASVGPGYTIKALDESTWPAFAGLVERNNGIFGGCWCMGFHANDSREPDLNRERKLARVRAGTAHAALVFDADDCVGWCQFGVPDEVPKIKNRAAYEIGMTELPDWRIACCFVGKGHRGQGVATAALAGALDLIAGLGGGTVEGYPEDASSVPAGFLFNGALSTYEQLGFGLDRKIGKHRWVVKKVVAAELKTPDGTVRGHSRTLTLTSPTAPAADSSIPEAAHFRCSLTTLPPGATGRRFAFT